MAAVRSPKAQGKPEAFQKAKNKWDTLVASAPSASGAIAPQDVSNPISDVSQHERKLSNWYVPGDIAVFLGLYFIVIPIMLLSGRLLPLLWDAHRSGDATLLYVALAFGTVGTVLLFLARLPLYRQQRFFTFGLHALDESHRRLYRWAYRFIGISLLLMLLLLSTVR